MKKNFLFSVAMLGSVICFAQVQDPVAWSFTSKKINPTTYEIHMTATIQDGWHVYSQSTPAGGPVPTAVEYAKNPLLQLKGKVVEVGKPERHHEPLFGVDVIQFSGKVDFVQTVSLRARARTALRGSIEFMTCNDKECLPPRTENFSIDIN
jgi:hypothetical protein